MCANRQKGLEVLPEVIIAQGDLMIFIERFAIDKTDLCWSNSSPALELRLRGCACCGSAAISAAVIPPASLAVGESAALIIIVKLELSSMS